jgi:hypothetical protein
MIKEDCVKITSSYLSRFEKTCPECNKVFLMQSPNLYAYKIMIFTRDSAKTLYYCSYSCWIKHKRAQIAKKKKRGRNKNDTI